MMPDRERPVERPKRDRQPDGTGRRAAKPAGQASAPQRHVRPGRRAGNTGPGGRGGVRDSCQRQVYPTVNFASGLSIKPSLASAKSPLA